MDFNQFCNICFYKQDLIKLHREEYEITINILISFIGEQEIIRENIIYLCTRCCETLKNYDKFRKMCVTNLIHFRHIYNQLKKKLEMCNDSDMRSKLSKFVEENVSKRDIYTNFDYLKENERICSTNTILNNEVIVSHVYEESTTNNANKVYIKSEYCDELLNNVEYPNIENENQEKEVNIFRKDESYVFPIKEEAIDDWHSEEEYQDLEHMNQEKDFDIYSKDENYILPVKQEVIEEISSQEGINTLEEISTKLGNVENNLHTEIDLGISGDNVPVKQEHKGYVEKIDNLQQGNDSSVITSKEPPKSSGRTGKMYQCNVCGKSMVGFTNFNRHMLVHTGEKPHKCTFCDRSFSLQGNLKTHIRTHTGEKPHMCNVCSKSFVTTTRLKAHERVHTGERPYKCNVCKRGFPKSSSLKTHQLVHNGEKIHTCNMCHKSFSRVGCLKRHQLVHTGQEVHTCTICNKSFSLLAYLKKHLLIHKRLNS